MGSSNCCSCLRDNAEIQFDSGDFSVTHSNSLLRTTIEKKSITEAKAPGDHRDDKEYFLECRLFNEMLNKGTANCLETPEGDLIEVLYTEEKPKIPPPEENELTAIQEPSLLEGGDPLSPEELYNLREQLRDAFFPQAEDFEWDFPRAFVQCAQETSGDIPALQLPSSCEGPGEVLELAEGLYYGELNNNKQPEGLGLLLMYDGTKCVGTFTAGRMTGPGRKTGKSQITYQGDFVEGLREGQGQLWSPEGVYEGEFKNNNFNGEGVFN